MSSILAILPLEITNLIASKLGPSELQSWRLVCRALNEQTIDTFGHLLFHTARTDLTFDNLHRLQSMSKSEHFAKHIRRLEVIKTENGMLGQGFEWPRMISGRLIEKLNGGDMLCDILSLRLPNCRSFTVQTYDEYEEPANTDRLVPSDAVGLLLSVITKAQLSVHSVVIEGSQNGTSRLESPRLQISLTQKPEFVRMWLHLEELLLDFSVNESQWGWVYDLITSAPKLRKLSIGSYDVDLAFMQRLSSSDVPNRLEELSLRSSRATARHLSSVLLQNCTTLCSLSIVHSLIADNDWASVFKTMQGQFPRLQYLKLFQLRQGETGETILGKVLNFSTFLSLPLVDEMKGSRFERRRLVPLQDTVEIRIRRPVLDVRGIEYRGQEIEHVLSILAETKDLV